jgi:hypothetical protein
MGSHSSRSKLIIRSIPDEFMSAPGTDSDLGLHIGCTSGPKPPMVVPTAVGPLEAKIDSPVSRLCNRL